MRISLNLNYQETIHILLNSQIDTSFLKFFDDFIKIILVSTKEEHTIHIDECNYSSYI